MQRYFLFVDTETKRIKEKNFIEERFYLGWLRYWDRKENIIKDIEFKEQKIFYNYVLDLMKTINNIIIFAHNTDFDIKVLGGISRFVKNGFDVNNFYIKGKTFILILKKKNKTICIYDTMNYVPMSLKAIGQSIGIKKMDIDFKTCSDNELSIYCKNDVYIIYSFIKKLIMFLESYELSKLKPTVSSLALNIFRHKFYNKKNNPIYIHGWNKAIELERMSYRGGISDCLKVGEHFKEKIFKLDINSMYAFIMKNQQIPVKLLYYRDITTCKSSLLFKLYNKHKKQKLIIARCKIFLPKKYAYILVKTEINKEKKSMFLSGTFNVTLTSLELDFVYKYGKIIEIYNLAIYEKSIIFKEYVEFFYQKRIEFDKVNNKAYKLFCKTLLNSLYGKFGQIQTLYSEKPSEIESYSSRLIIDTITDRSYLEMTLGNKIFEVEETDKNSFDSFVAISSFITSYARMYLIKLLLSAKRENVYYIDTDSLFVNQKGYDNLKSYIDNKKLGLLKLEETSNDTSIYRPKYYIFNHIEKCKGVKKSAKILYEDNNSLIIEQEQFTRFKTSLRKNEFNKQTINYIIKEISKFYDKGSIKSNGDIISYEVKL